MTGKETLDLDRLFDRARAETPVPPDDLVVRVLADAAAHQPLTRPAAGLRPAAPTAHGWFGGRFRGVISALFGGGGVLAGWGGAMIAGLTLGLTQPAPVSALTTALFDQSAVSVELLPGYQAVVEEGADDE